LKEGRKRKGHLGSHDMINPPAAGHPRKKGERKEGLAMVLHQIKSRRGAKTGEKREIMSPGEEIGCRE